MYKKTKEQIKMQKYKIFNTITTVIITDSEAESVAEALANVDELNFKKIQMTLTDVNGKEHVINAEEWKIKSEVMNETGEKVAESH
jgi:hypothetical protein